MARFAFNSRKFYINTKKNFPLAWKLLQCTCTYMYMYVCTYTYVHMYMHVMCTSSGKTIDSVLFVFTFTIHVHTWAEFSPSMEIPSHTPLYIVLCTGNVYTSHLAMLLSFQIDPSSNGPEKFDDQVWSVWEVLFCCCWTLEIDWRHFHTTFLCVFIPPPPQDNMDSHSQSHESRTFPDEGRDDVISCMGMTNDFLIYATTVRI